MQDNTLVRVNSKWLNDLAFTFGQPFAPYPNAPAYEPLRQNVMTMHGSIAFVKLNECSPADVNELIGRTEPVSIGLWKKEMERPGATAGF